MTELHIGLIGLGILGVLGVVAYNLWLEHRHRKLAGRLLNPSAKDVLLERDGAPPEEADAGAASEDAASAEPRIGMDDVAAYPADMQAVPEAGDGTGDGAENGSGNAIGDETRRAPAFTPGGLPRQHVESASFADARIEPVLYEADGAYEAYAADEAPLPEWQEALETPAAPDMSAHALRGDVANDAEHASPPTEMRGSEPLHLLSPAVDYIAALEIRQGLPAAEWLAARREAFSHLSKPVHWAGFDEENGEWILFPPMSPGASSEQDVRRYRHVRAGLQLADRRGALSEKDLAIFVTAMDDLARERQAVFDLPDPQAALAVAADLDAFCAGVDIQISINVVAADEAFQGTKIRALAEAAGMAIDADGRFVRADDDGNRLYVLLNHDPSGFSAESMRSMSAHGLTFLLDVPTVARGERVFGQVVDLAKRFAEVLKGVMVDDNRRPLSEASLEPIRRQIAQYQALMAERNLPAGGRMARRLFS